MAQTLVNALLQINMAADIQLTGDNLNTSTYPKVELVSNRQLGPSSTPDGEKIYSDVITMTGSAQEIDLTAVADLQGTSMTMNGKKMRSLVIKPIVAVGTLTISDGTNGYEIFGSGMSVAIPIGGTLACDLADGGQTVDSTHKIITLTGTASDTWGIITVFG